MSDIFDRVKKELEKKELKGSAKNRKDSPDSEDIPDVLLDIGPGTATCCSTSG